MAAVQIFLKRHIFYQHLAQTSPVLSVSMATNARYKDKSSNKSQWLQTVYILYLLACHI